MLLHYLKTAYKVFLRRKFFTGISLFAISFTLIVLMVVVSFLDHTFGPMAPEKKLDRMLGVFVMTMRGEDMIMSSGPGYGFLNRYCRDLPGVEKISFCTEPRLAQSYWNGEKIKSELKRTDGTFWEILDFTFLEGGPYSEADDRNAAAVAVINEATRRKFFAGEPAVGKTIEVDGQRFRVVGVVANVPVFRRMSFADIWVPNSTIKSPGYKTEMLGQFNALILARSRSDFPLIKSEFAARARQAELPDPKRFQSLAGDAETFFEFMSRVLNNGPEWEQNRPNRLIFALLFGMTLFMMLPAINLINLNVSRILERSSEIGVRKAFGASSWTLVGQFVTENVLLTLVGGAIGLVGAMLALRGITSSGVFPYAQFQMNYRIFTYGFALTLFFGLLSGVYPAWKMSRLHPVKALKGGTR